MARQSKEVYITGDPKIDIILQRIATRLDIIEGLNPDREGVVEVESDKDLSHATDVLKEDDVGTVAVQNFDNVNITGGKIKITDSDDTVIHQFGED